MTETLPADLTDLYERTILERSRRPRHASRLACFDAHARGDNPMCGDRVDVWVRREAGRIAEIGFEARGCAISIAAADLMAEAAAGLDGAGAMALGERVAELARTGEGEGADLDPLRPLAGVHAFPSRVGCATLAWRALRAALEGSLEVEP
ncbi:MAG: SUF system NifU family Fe-S cluster assembly protein [Rhodospirillales bacterium]|nr:SUF system NifU family Fe-S cluster assembly protein [Rhodospirillales bacterium]